ncbi:MAG: NAD(P)H-hydrate dehydratase [Gammaproteobacteria bacterium]|nr:NAD(P)H-hydrate dehydratase [Gammaproteobacteria bacterium]MDE2346148.1 NAD(P)H-hydrate dehydratase [Gammaproteobacteria bacterium]
MQPFSQALYTAARMRELDRRAEEEGIPAEELMRRAGKAAWRALAGRWPGAKRLAIFTGAGNNAGDGYVLGTEALRARRRVTVFTVGGSAKLSRSAARARAKYLAAKGKERKYTAASAADADVVVDALLGTGLDRPLTGQWADAVECINNSGKPVLALDVPSGLNADSGAIMGVAVRASLTVTFIGKKAGLYTGEGAACAGEVLLDGLAVPQQAFASIEPVARCIDASELRMPRRARTAHKGAYGHVLVIGGDHGMGGSVRLTAEAALRSGAGLVSVATRPAHVSAILAGLPEAMVHGLENAAEVLPLIERASVIAIGPGLGQGDWSRMLLALALDTQLPLVVDADALNLLAAHPVVRGQWVLTPHPGEAGRLLKQSIGDIQANRYQSAAQLAKQYRAVAVLKGAGSIIASADSVPMVCAFGNPGMAAPGMGDALTGVIAALIAQNLPLPEAASMGVAMHALAGDRAAQSGGERGLMARDLIAALRAVMNL